MIMKKKGSVVVVASAVLVAVLYNRVCCNVTVTVSQSFSPYLLVYCVFCFTTLSTAHSQLIRGTSLFFLPSFQRPGQYSIRASVNPHT
jgi:hypothetical protein